MNDYPTYILMLIRKLTYNVLLREALFTSVGWSKLDVRSVRPSVRADYNWFYLAAYEGWTHAAQQWDFENLISEKLFKKGSKLDWAL